MKRGDEKDDTGLLRPVTTCRRITPDDIWCCRESDRALNALGMDRRGIYAGPRSGWPSVILMAKSGQT